MLRWREVDQSKSSLPTAGTLVRPKHMQKVKETLAAPPQFGLGREEKNMNASSVASLVGEEKKTDVQVVESKADVALSAKIKTEEVDTDDDAEDESADVPLSAKVKTEEVETDDDAEDESADVPLSAGIKTEEEAADISKMMPSWNKSTKKWDIPMSWDNSKGLLQYSSLPAATDIYRQQKKEMNRQKCLAKL